MLLELFNTEYLPCVYFVYRIYSQLSLYLNLWVLDIHFDISDDICITLHGLLDISISFFDITEVDCSIEICTIYLYHNIQ